jgi:putative ABC transport system substrate-binding protein
MDTRLSRRRIMLGSGGVGLGLLAGCGRLPWQAQAQQPRRIPVVGVLYPPMPGRRDQAALQEGLRELGYIEGENIRVERRFGEGRPERLPELVAELLALPVDVLVAVGGAIVPARNATRTVPIVMVNSPDPVEFGLIDSLAHPGGNVTGLSILQPKLTGKRLELLKEAVPSISRVVALGAGDVSRQAAPEAAALGIQVRSFRLRAPNELEGTFRAAIRAPVDALLVYGNPVTLSVAAEIASLAAEHGLPMMADRSGFVEFGALMSYGSNERAYIRYAATYVDKILKGAKPADLPVEQPMTFDFVINLRTAQALGLTIPQHVLLQATEVIQ